MKKDIFGYEKLYFINNFSKIFSYPKKTRKDVREIKPQITNNGYLIIDLCKDGKVKKHLVHRLMAKTFLENPLKKPQVNHIDGNKQNNNLKNLEWVTRSENQLHSTRTGLRSAKGEKNSQSKLSESQVIDIYNDVRDYGVICSIYSISKSTVSSIKKIKTWKHILTEKQNI